MKIVCDSCGAKYQIADDKVSPGKVFKIRCKKCSASIVVRGEDEFNTDEATRVFDYGGDAVWHVVVEGDQQGPFAPLQLSGLLTDGKIDLDSYVWKDGFDGWKSLREVPELASLLGGGAADAPEASDDLFASADESGDADLFGASSGSPFAGSEPADEDVVASRPSPRVSAQQATMTGQRNENSVLFSLANLQSLATGSPSSASSGALGAGPSPAAAKPSAGFASGEASGLIDIRALASAAAAPRPAAQASNNANIDDLLSIGTGGPALGASPLASPLAAPGLAPVAREPEPAPASGGGNKALIAIVALIAVAAIAAAVFLALRPPAEKVIVREIQVGGPAAAPEAAAAPSAVAAPSEPAQPATTTAATTTPTPAHGATTGSSAAGSSSRERTSGTAATASAMTADTAASSASTMTAAATTAATTTTMTQTAAASGDINALVNMALGAPAAMETSSAANSALPETPSRESVASGLRAVAPQVRACGAGSDQSGSAPVQVVFRSNGQVQSANVTGQFSGSSIGSCIERVVKNARVPPFRNATFNVTFPYTI